MKTETQEAGEGDDVKAIGWARLVPPILHTVPLHPRTYTAVRALYPKGTPPKIILNGKTRDRCSFVAWHEKRLLLGVVTFRLTTVLNYGRETLAWVKVDPEEEEEPSE